MSSDHGRALPALPDHPLVYGSILDLIGDTPLLDLSGLRLPANQSGMSPTAFAAAGEARDSRSQQPPRGARLWGKLENLNPAGSVKDRISKAMIDRAEREGRLRPGGTVVEPTSGNTGIGLALVCARRGYRCVLTMPASMSLERRALLEALGAELVLTDENGQMEGAIAKARDIVEHEPNSFMPQQFDNEENPAEHYRTTAREILHSLGDLRIDAFVAGVGTGGTISGVGRFLREQRPGCRIVAVEAESCATISRGERGPTKIQGWAAGFVPRNYSPEIPHAVRTVTDDDAYRTKQALARQLGVLVGISSGGAVYVAAEIARSLPSDGNVVVVLPDTGERYFSLDEYFGA
jgi:cysteine synthase A